MMLLKKFWPLLGALILTFVLSGAWRSLPAVGRIFSPMVGIWNAPSEILSQGDRLEVNGLHQPVMVHWDRHGVPHIQAENLPDLFRAQGYVHARERLFQMDLRTRVGRAELSGLVGERQGKVYDQFFRKMGFRESVRRSLEKQLSDPDTKVAVENYVGGVNAWIDQLTLSDLPVEYRILGVVPERWELWRSAGILQMMIFNLGGRSYDLIYTRYAQKFGVNKILELFPAWLPSEFETPFADGGNKGLGRELVPDEVALSEEWSDLAIKPRHVHGSNNWAISGQHSTTGHSILVNDPHLDLDLPSIWFEQSLSAPGYKVYGASIPGAPSVIIGFNPHVGWAVTNGTTDVMDLYEVDSLKAPKWQVETDADGVEWANGRLVYERRDAKALIMEWMGHHPGNELKTFMDLNRARSFADCERAFGPYRAPIQNFICTDQNHIGVFHVGAVPRRKSSEGRFVRRIHGPDEFWQGEVPKDELPRRVDPKEGLVFSANQRPVPPTYTHWLSHTYAPSFRGQMIERRLRSKELWAPEEQMSLLGDEFNPLAERALPMMLKMVPERLPMISPQAWDELKSWDFVDHVDSRAATVFWGWWREIERLTWEELLGPKSSLDAHWPDDDKLLYDLLAVGKSSTAVRAEWVERLTRALELSYSHGLETFGAFGETWRYGSTRPVDMRHVAGIPGLSRRVESGGSAYSINAVKEHHGPSWRMIVALGPQGVRAWSQVAGGRSGNPFTESFDAEVSSWSRAQLKPVMWGGEKGEPLLDDSDRARSWTLTPSTEVNLDSAQTLGMMSGALRLWWLPYFLFIFLGVFLPYPRLRTPVFVGISGVVVLAVAILNYRLHGLPLKAAQEMLRLPQEYLVLAVVGGLYGGLALLWFESGLRLRKHLAMK